MMSWLSILRALLSFVYFFAWIAVVCSPVTYFLFATGLEKGLSSSGLIIYNIHWTFYLVLTFIIAGHVLILAMIYHLKRAAYAMKASHLINQVISKNVYKAGVYCVIAILLIKIPAFIYKLSLHAFLDYDNRAIESSTIDLGYAFDSVFIVVAFGIFLIVMSKIINQSIALKTENDLTI